MEGFLGLLEKLGNHISHIFENPGRKLKIFAKILYFALVIASIISAFKFGFFKYPIWVGETKTKFLPAVFFGLLILGPIVSYFLCLFIVVFGELVENSRK